MKKYLSIIVLVSIPFLAKAQTRSIQQRLDSIHTSVNTIATLEFVKKMNEMVTNTYKLYPTENNHISLLLDTTNGKIKLVQWNLDADNEFSVVLNDEDLSDGISLGKKTERFELYPTKSIFQFLLLDKITGNMWHVQWGFEPENNLIRKIQELFN